MKSISLVLKTITVTFLTMIAVQGQSNDGPTNSDCAAAWTSSSASNTCGEDDGDGEAQSLNTSVYTAVAQNNQCYIEVDCLTGFMGMTKEATYTGSEDDVKDLQNCTGDLKVGSC